MTIRLLSTLLFSLAFLPAFHSQGLMIIDASSVDIMPVTHDSVFVDVQDQVASITARHTYFNTSLSETAAKYAFPVPNGASVTGLRWLVNGNWYEASFSAEAQDSSLPGSGSGGPAAIIENYLGDQPFYFTFLNPFPALEFVSVEITYVMLLPYELGTVSFEYAHDLSGIQDDDMFEFYMDFSLESQRTIVTMDCGVNSADNWSDYSGEIIIDHSDLPPTDDVFITYELNNEELGLFSFSTFLTPEAHPDCDSLPSGFFGFIAEPPVSEDVEVINKVFTLIIDRSGSMSGDKISQAKEAASFIVENMNYGDYFNIVDFSSNVSSWQSDHVEYTNPNMNAALDYIDNIYASGSTNISGAFDTAVPDFANDNEELAHIIIFFTDGEATAGVTSTPSLVNHVNALVDLHDPNLIIFTFGIGDYVNENLLANIASSTNGLFEMVDNADLYEAISQFYLLIQNPVLLNTQLTFDPPIVSEVYPFPLQNLYMGQQLLVFGRYEVPQPVTVTLSGDAFGQEVVNTYYLDLADGMIESNAFLTSMWADQKIRSLQNSFYLSTDSGEQEALQEEIIDLSLCFGVVSDFTSLSDNPDIDIDPPLSMMEFDASENADALIAYPNPFTDHITLDLRSLQGSEVTLQLFNALGELIAELTITPHGNGEYQWDLSAWTEHMSPGTYLLKVSSDVKVLNQKLLHY